MGGSGSGRPRTKLHGSYSLEEKGKYQLNASKRFKAFSYNQSGKKFYGLKDKFTGQIYKRMDETAYNYMLRRFAKEEPDKILSRMEIYTKSGLETRANTARENIISSLNQAFDTNATFTINGKEYSLDEIIEKLKDVQHTEKWIEFANKYSDSIDKFFVGYRAEMGKAPPSDAGISDSDYPENINNEQDSNASDNYDKMFEMLEDLVTTFKI